MKIIRLKSENVLRLVAVDITPTGDLVIVGGKNDAGKSSVLNSIALALGGAAMCPPEPIRAGEAEGKVFLDLGDLQVTRRFNRHRITLGNAEGTPVGEGWSDTTSTLVVTNKEGARYPSPQAVLDKLLGKLTFDPLMFSRLSDTSEGRKQQDAILRKLVGVDVSAIEERRKDAYQRRAMLKKSHDIKVAQLVGMPFTKDAPADEIPMEEVSNEMLAAERLRKAAEDAEREVEKQRAVIASNDAKRAELIGTIALLRKQLAAAEEAKAAIDRREPPRRRNKYAKLKQSEQYNTSGQRRVRRQRGEA